MTLCILVCFFIILNLPQKLINKSRDGQLYKSVEHKSTLQHEAKNWALESHPRFKSNFFLRIKKDLKLKKDKKQRHTREDQERHIFRSK